MKYRREENGEGGWGLWAHNFFFPYPRLKRGKSFSSDYDEGRLACWLAGWPGAQKPLRAHVLRGMGGRGKGPSRLTRVDKSNVGKRTASIHLSALFFPPRWCLKGHRITGKLHSRRHLFGPLPRHFEHSAGRRRRRRKPQSHSAAAAASPPNLLARKCARAAAGLALAGEDGPNFREVES